MKRAMDANMEKMRTDMETKMEKMRTDMETKVGKNLKNFYLIFLGQSRPGRDEKGYGCEHGENAHGYGNKNRENAHGYGNKSWKKLKKNLFNFSRPKPTWKG